MKRRWASTVAEIAKIFGWPSHANGRRSRSLQQILLCPIYGFNCLLQDHISESIFRNIQLT